MKRTMLTILGILVCMLAAGSQAGATLFTFEGQDEGGIGSATMDLLVSGNTLTATVNNTSPIFCLDPNSDKPNTPGIVAFGFDVDNDPLPDISSWKLVICPSSSPIRSSKFLVLRRETEYPNTIPAIMPMTTQTTKFFEKLDKLLPRNLLIQIRI